MTLKTLKDLNTDPGFLDDFDEKGYYINIKELKAEAIKWIKELQSKDGRYCLICQSNECKHEESNDNILNEQDPYEPNGRIESIKWIKHFFNITDEDLK
mgnify:CR=1 FL=1